MVQGTVTEKEIAVWKLKHTPQQCEKEVGSEDNAEEKNNLAHLSLRCWRSFLKHHPQITSKCTICFDSQCDDWCTYANFVLMYKMV